MSFEMLLLRVPHVYQKIDGACGAACLKMIFKYYRVSAPSAKSIYQQIKSINRDPVMGLTVNDLVAYAHMNGMNAYIGDGGTLDVLRHYTERKIPVIATMQADATTKEGHIVVVTEVNNDTVIVNDPGLPNGKGIRYSTAEFYQLWQNFNNGEHVIVVPFGKLDKNDYI